VDSLTTTYTLDLNAGLTQVLQEGTYTYLYGNARIAQENTGPEYFLGDALGSVRQMASQTGTIVYAAAYSSYGEVVAEEGSSQTNYGFTGEMVDDNGMVFLRARYYSAYLNRFLTRDSWDGVMTSPITYNRWTYGNDNPITYSDPSGMYVFANFSSTGTNTWTEQEKNVVENQTRHVAIAYARLINQDILPNLWDYCDGLPLRVFLGMYRVTPTKAFFMIHGGPIRFMKTDFVASMGYTHRRNLIEFRYHEMKSGDIQGDYIPDYPNVVTHEIGHAFDNAVMFHTGIKTSPNVPIELIRPQCYDENGDLLGRCNEDPDPLTGGYEYWFGYAGGLGSWQFGQGGLEEEFADMFIGWVYNKWKVTDLPTGSHYASRDRVMNQLMNESLTKIFELRMFGWRNLH
jgi:RHS repeat-associated protein